MPYQDTSGRSLHRLRLGRGLYTASDAHKGPIPTPSQTANSIGESGLDKQWFLLTKAQKQLWQTAGQAITWNDLGRGDRHPTGRQLYNRLNHSRHRYYLSDPNQGKPFSPSTVQVPPGAPVQVGPVGGFHIATQAPIISGDDPGYPTSTDPYRTLEYARVQMCSVDKDGKLRTLDETDDPGLTPPTPNPDGSLPPQTKGLYTEHNDCPAIRLNLPTVTPGVVFDTISIENMAALGYTAVLFTADALYPKDGQVGFIGYYEKSIRTNYIDNYQYSTGFASLTAFPPAGAAVLIMLKWHPGVGSPILGVPGQPSSIGQRSDRWRYLVTLPPDVHALPLRGDTGLYEIGGTIMPDNNGELNLNYGAGSGTSDWSVSAARFNHSGIGGASLKFRFWPFTLDGWPGSLQEFSTIAGGPLTYAPSPDCTIPSNNLNP